jgi:4-amino-4-deoxy-L-arabinose transferase-like glycosyltransferase
MKKRLSLLILITLIGLFLRTYKLDVRPLGFTWDEAALGYNAYSLLKTGRDEFGQLAPVIFKSFGDYKPGLYIYYTVPAIKLLGLNEFATRLPSAIFGTLLILAVYLLARRLFTENPSVSLFAALVMAINPWALQFSRGAWEANLSLLLTVMAVNMFLSGLKNKNFTFYILNSSLLFGLSFWTYQGAKAFTPLIILALLFIYGKTLRLKKLILPVIILGAFLLPLLLGLSTQSGRLKVFSVFSYTRSPEFIATLLKQDHLTSKNWLFYLFHSEIMDQLRGVYQRYLNHLSPRFLFIQGDWTSLRLAVYNYGYFHLPEIITLLLGLVILTSQTKKRTRFIWAWLLLAPLPAAFSRDIVSGVRTLPLVIPLAILTGLGMAWLVKHRFLFVVYSLSLVFFFVYYLDLYYIHAPFYAAADWVYPYKPAIQLIKPFLGQYKNVVMTDKLGQPYIFFLFYLKIDPAVYQKQVNFIANAQGDVGRVPGFDQFSFKPVFWPALRGQTGTIFIGDQYELPEKDLNITNLVRLGDIYYPNGQHALRIVAVK